MANKYRGMNYESLVKQKYNLVDRNYYNNLNPSNKFSYAVRIKLNIPGKNFYEQFHKWDYDILVENIFSDKCKYCKCDAVNPIDNSPCEIKNIGKKDHFIFCEMLAIKDDGLDAEKYKLPINKYNEKIKKLHELYGEYLSNIISDKFRSGNYKIYTLNKILEIDKDFYLISNITNGQNGKDLGDLRWKIRGVIIDKK